MTECFTGLDKGKMYAVCLQESRVACGLDVLTRRMYAFSLYTYYTKSPSTAATRVRSRIIMGFVMDKVAMGQAFSEYFCFHCQ
jgi:hypothetical protein